MRLGDEMIEISLQIKIAEYISKRTKLEFHLVNGTKIYGKIIEIYDEAYLIDVGGDTVLVYKHSLAFTKEF